MAQISIQVKHVETDAELQAAHQVRHMVFIIGQNVPVEIEMDEFEDSATHIVALVDGNVVGTARWRSTTEGVKLERFAVLDEFRGQRVGAALMNYTLDHIDKSGLVYLNSQTVVIPFYASFGFEAVGPEFDEADILHRRMILGKREG